MILASITQQPNDRQDYDIDFSEWFPEGDIVNDATVSVSPAGLDYNSSVTNPRVKVWLSGGIAGVTYKVTILGKANYNALTAPNNANRYKEVELKVKVKDY